MTQLVIQPATLRTNTVAQVRTTAIGLATLTIAIVVALYATAVRLDAPPLMTAGMVLLAALVGAQGVRTDCGWNAASRLIAPGEHRPAAVLSSHVTGILVGSAVTAGLVAVLAAVTPNFGPTWLAFPLIIVGALRLFRATTMLPGGWKVRRMWERWGALRFMGVFGFFLGLGFVTTIVSPGFFLMAAWSVQSGTLYVPAAIFAGFAGGRIATSLIAAAGDAKSSSVICQTVDTVKSRITPLGYIEGGLAVLIGIALLVGVSV
ncbi:hypothetical protein [Glaciihabitans sp. UYNi722]|uniref:hypothetical protein n=1 Tax=Glaciihabitans sp. UYNi722 TaxID=3156344 RepID=UPI00339286C2